MGVVYTIINNNEKRCLNQFQRSKTRKNTSNEYYSFFGSKILAFQWSKRNENLEQFLTLTSGSFGK
jgi:hypothetical protein